MFMDAYIEDKLKLILQGELKYTSDNFAFNMLIKKLQRKIDDDPGNIGSCLEEIDVFAEKYNKIVAADFARIAVL